MVHANDDATSFPLMSNTSFFLFDTRSSSLLVLTKNNRMHGEDDRLEGVRGSPGMVGK